MELFQELQRLNCLLDKAINELKERGRNYATAKKEYRIKVSQELLRLRAENIPVTIINDIVKGKKEIAEAKEKEIINEALYRSCLEAINVYKLQINIVREQIQREYTNIK